MQIYAILPLRLPLKLLWPSELCGITVYQFTEHYITNANTVPMLILLFLYDFRGTWQADKQRLCGKPIRRCAACRWLVNVPAVPTNRCQLNVNQGNTKHATLQACPVPSPWRGLFKAASDSIHFLWNIYYNYQKAKTRGCYKMRIKTLLFQVLWRCFTINIAEIKMQLHILFTNNTLLWVHLTTFKYI